jgi:hypothetical protein
MDDILLNIISAIIVIGLFVIHIFSKKVHYFISGISLILIGLLDILFIYYIIDFDINTLPAIAFALYFILFFAGKDLFVESIKEDNNSLKYFTLIIAILIILLTTIPTLSKFGVINFNLPDYPNIVDSIINIVAGITLIIGTFILLHDK